MDSLHVLVTGQSAEEIAGMVESPPVPLDVRVVAHPEDADLAWADCFVGFTWPAGATERVSWIHGTGLGLDGLLRAPRPGLVTRTVGDLPEQLGRYVLAAILAEHENHDRFAAAQSDRAWDPVAAGPWPARAVVLGTGDGAQGIAEVLARNGIEATGVSRSGRAAPHFARTLPWSEVEAALSPAPEILVNALPLTPETRRLVDARVLDRLDRAVFVNIGRGPSVDEDALRSVLDDGGVAAAWLDVHSVEPLPAGHWSWSHPRVRITPHVAALTRSQDVAADLLAALRARESGDRPPTAVDPDSVGWGP